MNRKERKEYYKRCSGFISCVSRYLFLWVLCGLFSFSCYANNLQITNVKVLDNAHLQCTVSWENSWKLEGITAPYNHDAVWIFIKYKGSNGNWTHLSVSDSAKEFGTDTSVVEINPVKDETGFFISRKKAGSGTVSSTTVTIPIKTTLSNGDYEFKVFGIEMVWVNTGGFYIGDAWSQRSFSRGDTLLPFYIASENRISAGKDSLSLRDTGIYDPKATIPDAYPKGYAGFYCMKYEITQNQYVDFLNCLTFTQQKNRTISSPDASPESAAFYLSNRNGIIISTSGNTPNTPAQYSCNAHNDNNFNSADDGQDRACNFLNWADVGAYLDWAALSPMTELEFEKICRGPNKPVQGEFAWGTASSVDANTLINDGTNDEAVTDSIPVGAGIASYGYLGPQGPLRSGFAANTTTDRLQSGATYFGVMEMSGNVWEYCVGVNTGALLFDGLSGDGILDINGDFDANNWPSKDGSSTAYRGGAWLSGVVGEFRDPAVSARFYAGLKADTRRNTSGGRGVRTKF